MEKRKDARQDLEEIFQLIEMYRKFRIQNKAKEMMRPGSQQENQEIMPSVKLQAKKKVYNMKKGHFLQATGRSSKMNSETSINFEHDATELSILIE